MSGLKTAIRKNIEVGEDSLTLDQYPDGSVRLICDEGYMYIDEHGIMKFKRRAMIHLSKKEMIRLITKYLKYDQDWD